MWTSDKFFILWKILDCMNYNHAQFQGLLSSYILRIGAGDNFTLTPHAK